MRLKKSLRAQGIVTLHKLNYSFIIFLRNLEKLNSKGVMLKKKYEGHNEKNHVYHFTGCISEEDSKSLYYKVLTDPNASHNLFTFSQSYVTNYGYEIRVGCISRQYDSLNKFIREHIPGYKILFDNYFLSAAAPEKPWSWHIGRNFQIWKDEQFAWKTLWIPFEDHNAMNGGRLHWYQGKAIDIIEAALPIVTDMKDVPYDDGNVLSLLSSFGTEFFMNRVTAPEISARDGILFDERTPHGSEPSYSKGRFTLAVRLIPEHVSQKHLNLDVIFKGLLLGAPQIQGAVSLEIVRTLAPSVFEEWMKIPDLHKMVHDTKPWARQFIQKKGGK